MSTDFVTINSCSLRTILGTDDDLPPSHPNRMSRGARVAGNGRSGALSSIPYSRAHGETDMESEIHLLEQEAYISVLRAFKAQADAITWVFFCPVKII